MEQMTPMPALSPRNTSPTVLHQVVQTLEDQVSHEVYRLIECAGCHNISMAHLSFYDDFDFRRCVKQRYYPSLAMRKLPLAVKTAVWCGAI